MGENVQKTRYAYISVLRAIAMLLVGRVSSSVGIDEGYIVSALYAVILFYVFWKMKDMIANNRVTAYFDSIGLSFFFLHNCIGWLLMQGMYLSFCMRRMCGSRCLRPWPAIC